MHAASRTALGCMHLHPSACSPARITTPAVPTYTWAKVPDFLARTRADILAVTVGNVHGRYARPDPRLDLARLGLVKAAAAEASPSMLVSSAPSARQAAGRFSNAATFLAIHGASGLPDSQVKASTSLGVCKYNVNTEVRTAAIEGLRAVAGEADGAKADYLGVLEESVENMTAVIAQKMLDFDYPQ